MNINLKETLKKINLSFRRKTEKNKTNYRKKKLMPMLTLFLVIIFIGFPVHQARAGFFDPLIDFFVGGIGLIVYNAAVLALSVTNGLVHFGAFLIDIMLTQEIYTAAFSSTAVMVGWTTIRDFCNMFFIFFLLVMAFATILRIQQYSVKSLLPKFLIAIFLINFSMEITKVVIDFGQVFMYQILSWMGSFSGPGGGGGGITSISDYFYDKYHMGAKYDLTNVVSVLFAVAYTFALALIYIMLAGFLLVRLVTFVILMILSPFAFFAAVFPSTRTYSSQWWGSLVKYSLFGPIFIFFVYLSTVMAFGMSNDAALTAKLTTPWAGYSQVSMKDIIITLIPNVVSLAMLLAVIPITQKLGIAGSNKLIGGTMGLGAVAMGSYGAAKLAGGWGKKIGGGAAERVHGTLMGKSAAYRGAAEKISGKLKTNAITGRIALQYEADRAQKKKDDVAKHQKIMENLSDKDKKSYVDSFSIDRKGKADAQQAMFNLLAKDSGKGLTDNRLQKMGYEKEVTLADGSKEKTFDKEKFASDYNRAKAYGHDTGTLESYRPDLIQGKDTADTTEKKQEKVAKIVQDGNYKSIKADALVGEEGKVIADELEKLIGKKKYDEFINNKSQEEKDTIVKDKEKELVRFLGVPAGPMPEDLAAYADELNKMQGEIAGLSSVDMKGKRASNVSIGVNGKIEYTGTAKIEVVKNMMDNMTKDQFIDLKPEQLKDWGRHVSDSNIEHIAKFGETDQLKAIKESVENRMRDIADPANAEYIKLDEKLDKLNKKL